MSDFDLTDANALQDARATLDPIKASALDTDASTFDPSGTTVPEDDIASHRPRSSPEDSVPHSNGTELTSLSNGVSSLSLAESATSSDIGLSKGYGEHVEAVEKSDDATKTKELKTMFPDSTDYAINHTLKNCNGDFVRAMDELLNHSFIQGEGMADGADYSVGSKGVDAFSEDSLGRRGRKKNGKKKQKYQSLDEARSSSSPASPTESPWKVAKTEIEFVTSRTNVSHNTVASVYHQHGASLPTTIKALLVTSAEKTKSANVASDDAVIQAHAYELGHDFPTIEPSHLTELIRLTHPSTAAAHELAKAMIAQPHKVGRIEVIPRYAPINVHDEEDAWISASSPRRAPASPATTSDPASLASTYAAASSRAYGQANAAYRRGKSDALMGAAAGYYSQVGRDYATRSREATAEAADALVAANSSAGTIDLHGVSVKDAVRIARGRTAEWWRVHKRRAVGVDGRVHAEEGTGGELTIVTGVGRHSRGGKGLIGPAVGRMLMQEGWEARCGEGHWIVYGKR